MSMNPFSRKVQYFEFGPRAADQIERLISAVEDNPPIGETSVTQKLQAIIDMLMPFGDTPDRLNQMDTRLETIHELIFNLVNADPEKIKEITNAVRSVKEELKSSVDSQKEK